MTMAELRITDLTIEYTRSGYVVRPIEEMNEEARTASWSCCSARAAAARRRCCPASPAC